jgi:hypothetical protein
MKSLYKIVAFGLLCLAAGCTKQLHKDPIGLITPGQISTDLTINTVNTAVTSSYQMLANTLNIIGEWRWDLGTVFRNDYVLQDMASDDMMKKWNPDGDQAWMDNVVSFTFTASNQAFNGQWTYDYEGISRSNQAISYLTDEALISKIGIDPALRSRLLGEVYFLRAFYYFDLVNNFGDVPLLLKPLTTFSDAYSVAKRVSKDTIWAQISTDLAAAKTLLPNSKYSDNTDKWRVSLGAVLALQAKVALFKQQWQDVISDVTELEALGFALDANYFDNFDVTKKYAENEVIFSYNHTSNTTPRNGNGICAPLDWGFFAPTTDFLKAFEPNDPRLGLTVNVKQKAVYKLLGATNTSFKGNDDAPSNKVYFRMADALLWKAEAYLETDNLHDAITIINQVRARARTSLDTTGHLPPAGTLQDRDVNTTDKNVVKEWLMHERRVELGFESERFYDLKRWGIAKQVLTALGKNFQDFNNLYPIPQGEIDKSGGTIVQNQGY